MKRVLLLFITAASLLVTLSLHGQSISVIEGVEISYSATVGNSQMYDKVSDCDLFVRGGVSLFRINKDATDNEASPKIVTGANGQMEINIKPKVKSDRLFYLNHPTGELIARLNIFDQSFNVTEDIPDFNWQVTEEKKVVAGYTCHQATGMHRGRKFTAWFTPQIPVNAGPWKFSGLPGLILEVNEDEGKYNWYCKNIKPLKESNAQLITPPTEKHEVTFGEYYDLAASKLREKFEKLASNPNITISGEFSMDGGLERTKE